MPVEGNSALLDSLAPSNAFEPSVSRFPFIIIRALPGLNTHNNHFWKLPRALWVVNSFWLQPFPEKSWL
jgi:hypothetical protein